MSEEKIKELQIEDIQEEDEEASRLDVKQILRRIWQKKILIICITLIFIAIGLLVALSKKNFYTASCLLVAQTSSTNGGGGAMSSIASSFGLSLGNNASSGELSPMLYPQIIKNVDYQKELMRTPLNFKGYDEPITFMDYYTDPQYSTKKSLIKKSKKNQNTNQFQTTDSLSSINSLNFKEQLCKDLLDEKVVLYPVNSDGSIVLRATMNEPLAAAQLADAALQLVQKYITDFKIQKAKSQQEYIRQRHDEAKLQYEQAQKEYAHYQDANRLLSTATSQIEMQRLQRNYELAFALYSQLSSQLITADLQVKEDTPILTVVDPIVIPYKKAGPHRSQLLFVWTAVGFIIGILLVVGLDFIYKSFGWKPKWWKVEESEVIKE